MWARDSAEAWSIISCSILIISLQSIYKKQRVLHTEFSIRSSALICSLEMRCCSLWFYNLLTELMDCQVRLKIIRVWMSDYIFQGTQLPFILSSADDLPRFLPYAARHRWAFCCLKMWQLCIQFNSSLMSALSSALNYNSGYLSTGLWHPIFVKIINNKGRQFKKHQ